MRRFITVLGCVLFLTGTCGCQKEVRDDDTPTAGEPVEVESSETPVSSEAPDALATAEAWLMSEPRQGLTAETRAIAASWKDAKPVVLRVFRENDAYLALVGVDTSERVLPAILLKLEESTNGWMVTRAESASTDLLWPSI